MKPSKADFEVVKKWTDFPDDRLLRWGDEVFAVPCAMDDYLHLFKNLKIVKAGTKIFNLKKNDYLPSFELALSPQLKNDAFPREEVDLAGAIAMLRRDNFKLQNAARGWNIVTYKNISLGYVNNIGNRVNNYFPVEWRIRMNLPEAGMENIIKWEKHDSGRK